MAEEKTPEELEAEIPVYLREYIGRIEKLEVDVALLRERPAPPS